MRAVPVDAAEPRPRRLVHGGLRHGPAGLLVALWPCLPGCRVGPVALLFAPLLSRPFRSATSAITRPNLLQGELYQPPARRRRCLNTTLYCARGGRRSAGAWLWPFWACDLPLRSTGPATFVLHRPLLISLGVRARPAPPRLIEPVRRLARCARDFRMVFAIRYYGPDFVSGLARGLLHVQRESLPPYATALGGGPLATALFLAIAVASKTILISAVHIRLVRPRHRAHDGALWGQGSPADAPRYCPPSGSCRLAVTSRCRGVRCLPIAAQRGLCCQGAQTGGDRPWASPCGCVVVAGATFLAAGAAPR